MSLHIQRHAAMNKRCPAGCGAMRSSEPFYIDRVCRKLSIRLVIGQAVSGEKKLLAPGVFFEPASFTTGVAQHETSSMRLTHGMR